MIVPTNPCEFCGHSFKQYHKCHLVRQMALLLAEDGYQPQELVDNLACEYCGKAYTTRHGLQQHVQVYHAAEQASQELDEDTITAHCLIHEAVLHDRCEDILGSEAVQFFLATQCLSCHKSFARKQELKRHLKQNHSSEWNECERRAFVLDAQHKPQYGCVCHPKSHMKHICNFFLQFALLRIDQERQRRPQVVATPPDQVLSIAEQIETILWLGHPQVLYKQLELRVNLTVQCQICGWSGNSATELHTHLHALHADHLQEVQNLKALFQWCMFGSLGCFCNPGPSWGELNHECVGLTHLAIIARDFQWPVILPWTFSSTDLVQLLGDMLPREHLQRICMDLMTRNFHRIWADSNLLAALSSRCLLCQEPVDLQRIKAHLFVMHQVDESRVTFLTQQLGWVYADLLTDEHRCDWCRSVIPSHFTDTDEIIDPVAHLTVCPMVMQMAILLMMPKWSSPGFIPFTWPRLEEIESGFRQLDLKLWQFNVWPSDTFGMDFDLLAKCGLDFIQDGRIADKLQFQCLLCQRCFFLPSNFAEHLHTQHNYMQYHTLMCLHRLESTCETPCQYCNLPQHSKPCLPLLNLAVFLINGHGIRGARWLRIGTESVGKPPQCDPTSTIGQPDHRIGSGEQTPQARRRQVEAEGDDQEQGHGDGAQTGHFHIDQARPEARRWTERFDDRSPVSTSYFPGHGIGAAGTSSEESTMAWRGPHHVPESHTGSDYDSGPCRPPGQVDQSCSNNRALPGLRQMESDHPGFGTHNAVLEVGCKKKELVPSSKQGLPVQSVQRSLSNILRLLADQTWTLRFHALKKPVDDPAQTTAIPFIWTTSLRSPELWAELQALCFHSIWRLILVQLRPQTLERQPLAKQLQQTL